MVDENLIQKVWEKAKIIKNYNPDLWRKDECNAWIKRSNHGNRNSLYGWEIDHISPSGGDNISNLRPLQWKNNVDKSDERLICPVISQETRNIDKK